MTTKCMMLWTMFSSARW